MEMAVFDGTTTRWSSDGKADSVAARVIANDAAGDAGATGLFFDSSYYRKALDSGDVLYAGLDDVEGDLCHVIAYVTLMDKETGSDTRYVWISAQTGLPRSTQSWRLVRGKTLLTARWIISNIEMNAVIAPETFTYVPTASDSTKPAPVSSICSGVEDFRRDGPAGSSSARHDVKTCLLRAFKAWRRS